MTTIDKVFVREAGGCFIDKRIEPHLSLADNEDYDRLLGQHQAITTMLGSLYAAPHLVRAAMASNGEMPPAAIDIGTGSGHWATDFATEFPGAAVVGIDLVPPTLKRQIPSNCRFDEHDANIPLKNYHGSFNLCHIRSVDDGIKNPKEFLYHIPDILRTNGVLLMTSGDVRLYTEDKKPCPIDIQEGEPGWCATQAIFWRVSKWGVKSGIGAAIRHKWAEWLAENPYLTSAGTEDVLIPIGPWINDHDDRLVRAAKLMQINVLQIIEVFRAILLSDGMDAITINRWITIANEELNQSKPRLYTRWAHVWCLRNSVEWVPKSP